MNKTKKLIFESAILVFSECGYNGAAMDEIASRAGVAKGTLYYHFKSKEDIFKFIINEGMNVMSEETEAAITLEENPIEKLKVLCRVELTLAYKNRDFFKVLMSQLWGEQVRQYELREVIHNYIQNLEQYIKDAMDGGYIKKGETSFIAYTLFGTLCSASIYEMINKEKAEVEVVIDSLVKYILNGIAI